MCSLFILCFVLHKWQLCEINIYAFQQIALAGARSIISNYKFRPHGGHLECLQGTETIWIPSPFTAGVKSSSTTWPLALNFLKFLASSQLNFSIGVVTSVGLTRRSRQDEALKMWGILIAQALSGF